MSKKTKPQSKTSAKPRYINDGNCAALLGDFSTIRNRRVAEILEHAFHFFATGVTCVAFPIKKNGGVSIKKAFAVRDFPPTESQSKKTSNALVKFVRDIQDVAKSSLHAREKFRSNGFNIDIVEQKLGEVEVVSITALEQKGHYKNTRPTLTPRAAQLSNDTVAASLFVPLLALMAPFKLDPAGYTCVSQTYFSDDEHYLYGSIHAQSDSNVTRAESSREFHRWLFNHFKSISDSSIAVKSVNNSHISAMEWQETFVDELVDSHDDRSLHITPGGMKGRIFLKDLGLLPDGVIDHLNPTPEHEFLNAIERFSFMSQPSPNGNNQLKEDWKKSWYESRPPRSHLTLQQAANITKLARYDMAPRDIESWTGARIQQIRRVLRNESFRDVRTID